MSSTTPALTPRQAQILSAVCRDYVVTGREVSSGGLVRAHGFPWSSATIRQELAVLEQLGYLRQAHRSAGRLPTRAGLGHYVASLPKDRTPPPELVRAVDRSIGDLARPEVGMRTAAWVLSEISGCVAVSFLGSTRTGVMQELDVVSLVGERALVVLTMDDGATVMQPVVIENFGKDTQERTNELLRLQEKLRWLCRGRTLAEARGKLFELRREQEARFDHVLAEALRLGLSLCTGASLDPLWLQVAGKPALTRDLPQLDRLGDLLELLEDVQRLAEVLCQLLPAPDGKAPVRAEVRVGGEGLLDAPNAFASVIADTSISRAGLEGLTLVGCRVPAPRTGQNADAPLYTGAVALLGSDRMDYAAVIPLVEYAARALAARTCA